MNVLTQTEVAILADLVVMMAIIAFGNIIRPEDVDEYFKLFKERLLLQKLPEKDIDKILGIYRTAVGLVKEGI